MGNLKHYLAEFFPGVHFPLFSYITDPCFSVFFTGSSAFPWYLNIGKSQGSVLIILSTLTPQWSYELKNHAVSPTGIHFTVWFTQHPGWHPSLPVYFHKHVQNQTSIILPQNLVYLHCCCSLNSDCPSRCSGQNSASHPWLLSFYHIQTSAKFWNFNIRGQGYSLVA